MSKDFEKFNTYYDEGYWNEERIRNVTEKGSITEEEFELIVGKKFEE